MQRNPEAEQHLKHHVHCFSRYMTIIAAQARNETWDHEPVTPVDYCLPMDEVLKEKNKHNSFFEAHLHLLLEEACAEATVLEPRFTFFHF